MIDHYNDKDIFSDMSECNNVANAFEIKQIFN